MRDNPIDTPFNMIDCRELLVEKGGDNRHFHFSIEKLEKSKPGVTWLCPHNIESLSIRGSFGSEFFDFVRIRLTGCDLGDACASDEETSQMTLNFVMSYQYPNILSDNKKEPILYY